MPEASKGPAATPGVFIDPFPTCHFKIMILGIIEGHFIGFSGFRISVDNISYVEGGSPVEHQIPGRAHYDPVTLKYGFTQSRELWDWMMSAAKQPVQRRNVQIIILDADGITEKVRWTLYNAWPVEWIADDFDAGSSAVAIHRLKVAYENCDQQ
jgi:phage tail-like protein